MTAKIFVVTTDERVIQIGGTWWGITDAASDINGGDFYRDLKEQFPVGAVLKEIRIVPDQPEPLEWA